LKGRGKGQVNGKGKGAGKIGTVFYLPKEKLIKFISSIKPTPLIPFGGKFQEFRGKIDLQGNLTMIPPVKQVFLPDKNPSFLFDKKTQKIVKSPAEKERVLFGVNPLDIRALDTLDEVFEKIPYYQKRRKASIVIGAGDAGKSGKSFDLFFHDDGQGFIVLAGSEKGRAFARKMKLSKFSGSLPEIGTAQEKFLLDAEKLREKVKRAPKEVWEEVARTCLGCGICSYVCPLCYCFEVEDRVPIGGKTGTRCTKWDSCMLESFSEVAGGHVFQKNLSERIKNWYFHKFARATSERGSPDCVGCDRCFHFCPVAINFREVLGKC